MNYRDPRLATPLAASYALGTLRGAARQRFARLLDADAALRKEVDFWELRLARLGCSVAPLAPPAEAWANINRSIDAAESAACPLPPRIATTAAARRPIRRWRLAAGLAAAASLLLVAYRIGQQNAGPADAAERIYASARAGTERWQPLPMYVAQVRMPTSSMAWLISLSPDRRQLTAVAAEDFLQVGRHSVELWLHSPKRGLVPLGLLPCVRDASMSMNLPEGLDGQSEVTFTISLEPSGGSPTGQPTGPMMNSAADRGAI